MPTRWASRFATASPELWHLNRVLFGRVMAGETVTFEDERYDFDRAAGVEEAYFTASHSPIRLADGTVGGVLTTILETTNRVRSQRMQAEREHLLRELEVERSRLEEMFRQAPSFLGITRGPEHVMHFVNDTYMQLVGHRDIVGKRLVDAIPEVKEQGFIEILDRVLATGTPFVGREIPVKLQRTPGAPLEEIYVDLVYQPLVDADGTRFGIAAHGSDVTDQVLARREVEAVNRQLNERAGELRASEARLRDVFNQAPLAVAVLEGPDARLHHRQSALPARRPGAGVPSSAAPIREVFPELEGQGFLETMDHVYETGEPFFANERLVMLDRDGDGVTEPHWFNVGYQPLRDAAGSGVRHRERGVRRHRAGASRAASSRSRRRRPRRRAWRR